MTLPPLTTVSLRMMFPFIFDSAHSSAARRRHDRARDRLLAHKEAGTAVWETPSSVHGDYLRDATPATRDLLFGNDSGSFRYLRVQNDFDFEDRRIALWRHGAQPHRQGKPSNCPIFVLAKSGIELWLSPYGIGIMSIGLATRDESAMAGPDAQNLNYLAADLREGRKLFLGDFDVWKTCRGLLAPLDDPIPIRAIHSDCATMYMAGRFPAGVDFDDRETTSDLLPLLSALAQVEESAHPGAARGVCNVPCARLTRLKWAAVGQMGTAVLLADQPEHERGHDFNDERIQRVMFTHFRACLISLFHRYTVQYLQEALANTVRSDDNILAHDKEVGEVRRDVLAFSASANLSSVSTRDEPNRYYQLALEGYRVREAFALLDTAVEGLNALQIAMAQLAMQRSQVAMQRNVEWIEVFLVGYYALAATFYLGEILHLVNWYVAIAMLGFSIAAVVFAVRMLHPPESGHSVDPESAHDDSPRWRQGLRAFFVLLVVYITVGLLLTGWVPNSTAQSTESAPAEASPAGTPVTPQPAP
jgi:hypothetical protein